MTNVVVGVLGYLSEPWGSERGRESPRGQPGKLREGGVDRPPAQDPGCHGAETGMASGRAAPATTCPLPGGLSDTHLPLAVGKAGQEMKKKERERESAVKAEPDFSTTRLQGVKSCLCALCHASCSNKFILALRQGSCEMAGCLPIGRRGPA